MGLNRKSGRFFFFLYRISCYGDLTDVINADEFFTE